MTKDTLRTISIVLSVVILGMTITWWLVRALTSEAIVRDTPPEALLQTLYARGYSPERVFLRGLRSSDKLVRVKSVWGVGEVRSVRSVPALAVLLSDNVPTLRDAAFTALGKIGPRAAPGLVDLIRRADSKVDGERFASLLAGYGESVDAAALRDILRRGKLTARKNAALALGRMGDTSSTPALTDALQRDSLDVKVAAAQALGELRASTATPILAAAVHGPDPALAAAAVRALGRIGDSLVARDIAACLQHPDTGVVSNAIAALATIRSSEGIAPLVNLLRARGRPWRLFHVAILTAVRLCAVGRETILAPLVDDPDPDVRSLAISILVTSTDRGIVPTLVDIANSGAYESRKKAIAALGTIGSDAAPVLMRLLNDTSVYVRRDAMRALCLTGDRRVVPVLLSKVRAIPKWNVKGQSDADLEWQEAALTLGRMSERRAAPVLRSVLSSPASHADRSIAADALGLLKDSASVNVLIAALSDSTADTLGRIATLYQWDVRVASARALGLIGDRRAVRPLLAVTRCRNPDAQGAAREAVCRLDQAACDEAKIVRITGGREMSAPIRVGR